MLGWEQEKYNYRLFRGQSTWSSPQQVLVKGRIPAPFMVVQVGMGARDSQCDSTSPVILLDPLGMVRPPRSIF